MIPKLHHRYLMDLGLLNVSQLPRLFRFTIISLSIEAPGDCGHGLGHAKLHLHGPCRDVTSVPFIHDLFHCSDVLLLARFLHDHDGEHHQDVWS